MGWREAGRLQLGCACRLPFVHSAGVPVWHALHARHHPHCTPSPVLQAVLHEELGADPGVFAAMLLLEPTAVVEGCAHALQQRVARLVEVGGRRRGRQEAGAAHARVLWQRGEGSGEKGLEASAAPGLPACCCFHPHAPQEFGQQGALDTVMDMPTLLTVDEY